MNLERRAKRQLIDVLQIREASLRSHRLVLQRQIDRLPEAARDPYLEERGDVDDCLKVISEAINRLGANHAQGEAPAAQLPRAAAEGGPGHQGHAQANHEEGHGDEWGDPRPRYRYDQRGDRRPDVPP